MLVREARLSDAAAIAEVNVASWRAAYSHLIPASYLQALSAREYCSKWSDTLSLSNRSVFVAEADQAVVGYIEFGPCETQASCELMSFYVHPHNWSRGVGRKLWLAARSVCFEHEVEQVFLWVLAQNVRGIRFYKEAGFVSDSSIRIIERGGVQLEQVRYVQKFSG